MLRCCGRRKKLRKKQCCKCRAQKGSEMFRGDFATCNGCIARKSGQGTTPRKWKPWQNYHAEIRDTSRYLKKKKYNQLEVDCEVCGCKVKKNKWARHVGIWWGERVGRTEHHALPLLLWLYTRLDFYAATTVANAGGLRSCFQKFSESFEAAVSHLLSAGPGCSFTGFHGTRRCESLWGEVETITSLREVFRKRSPSLFYRHLHGVTQSQFS